MNECTIVSTSSNVFDSTSNCNTQNDHPVFQDDERGPWTIKHPNLAPCWCASSIKKKKKDEPDKNLVSQFLDDSIAQLLSTTIVDKDDNRLHSRKWPPWRRQIRFTTCNDSHNRLNTEKLAEHSAGIVSADTNDSCYPLYDDRNEYDDYVDDGETDDVPAITMPKYRLISSSDDVLSFPTDTLTNSSTLNLTDYDGATPSSSAQTTARNSLDIESRSDSIYVRMLPAKLRNMYV